MLGIIHAIHCPALIVYPYITNRYDAVYLFYFWGMIASYHVLNNECAMSYYAKKQLDSSYVAGSRLNWYPEMHIFTTNDRHLKMYFTAVSIWYLSSLYKVIVRNRKQINKRV